MVLRGGGGERGEGGEGRKRRGIESVGVELEDGLIGGLRGWVVYMFVCIKAYNVKV